MRCILVVVLSTLIGCASSHGPLEPPGDASTTTPADAMVPDDGGIHDMPEPLATAAELELVGDWWVSDAIATVDGEVCISGRRRGLEGSPLLPEVGRQDAFVACFDPSGRTRVRTWPCAGYSFGAGMLAANDAGDLFVELPDRCSHGDAHSVSILRLDRALDERASAGFVASESPMPRVNGLGATDAHVVVAGVMRAETTIEDRLASGPFVAVLAADDLSLVSVVSSLPGDEEPSLDVSIRHLAVRGDGVALLFGVDYERGAFRSSGGSFVRTMPLPDGAPTAIAPEEVYFHHKYAVAWHPDGRPTAIGTAGSRTLRIQLGEEVHSLWTDYASSPHVAYREGELLVARRMFDSGIDLAGRHLSADRWGGFLLSADSSTFEPRWAQGLPIGYQEYRVLVLPDGHIAVVASRARDGVPGMNLTFYRGE